MPLNSTLWHQWPTNFSNGTRIDGIGNYFVYMNSVTSGFLSSAMLLIIWLITFFSGYLLGVRKSAAAAFFVSFVFSIYFMRLGWMNVAITFILLLGAIVSAAGSKGEGQF